MKSISAVFVLLLLAACSEKTADQHLAKAKQQLIADNNPAAIISLKNVIQQQPTSAEARFILGKIYWQEHQYLDAEKELNKALSLKYPAYEIIPFLSRIYHKSNDDVALVLLEHNLAEMSAELKAEIAFYKLQAHLRLKQENEARKIFEEIQTYKTTSAFKALADSYMLASAEKSIQALDQVNKLLKAHPQQGDALKLKAMLLLKANKNAAAVNVYRQYTKIYPEDLISKMFFARILIVLNQTEEAEPIIDSLIKIYKNNMLLNQLKGVARFNAKDNQQALFYTEKAIQQDPENAALRFIAGYSAYELNNCETAYKHLSVIADEIPATHPAFRLLAICQANLGLGIEAHETLKLIDLVSTPDAGLFSTVSLALIKQGERLKAKELLSMAPLEGSSDDLVRLGIVKLSLNDITANINLELAYEQTPNEKDVKTTLATAYLETQQIEKALSLAKQWKKVDVNDTQAYLVAGLAYIKKRDYDNAKIEFQQLLNFEPDNLKAKLLLIDVLDKLGDKVEAMAELNVLLKQNPLYVPALVKLYLIIDNKTEAVSVIKSKVESAPQNIELILALAKVLMAEGDHQSSVTLLTSIAEHLHKSDTYWNVLGQAYMQSKDYKQAKRHYQAWLAEQPNSKFALIGNLVLMDLFREYNEALILTNNHFKKQGRDSQVELLNIHFLIKTEDFTLAEQRYNRLPELTRDLPFAKGLIGQIQMYKNNFIDALPNLVEAYINLPTTQNVQLIYQCYYGLKQPEKSYDFLKKHVNNYPEDLESLMQLAALQINSNLESSIINYEKALKIAPNNFIALNNLASLYLKENQLDKAGVNASKALSLQPENTYVLDTYGQILLAKKEYKNALFYFSKAVRDESVIDEIYLNYVEALFLNKQYKLVKRKLEQRKFTSSGSLERLADLEQKYKN